VRHRLAIAAVALALIGCGDNGEDGSSGSTPSGVEAADFRFAPATLRVRVGATVAWTNTGRTAHTIKGPGFFSRAVGPGGIYSHRFSVRGEYDYVCTLHPDPMRGRVVVGAGSP
jgi:plastocyanin